MNKQKAEELKRHIDNLASDKLPLIKHTIAHALLSEIESYHKQLHREEKGCNSRNV